LTAQIRKPIEKLADEMWPGTPIVPVMEPGSTDAQFLNPAGIPTYGVSGLFEDADGGNIHGLNERIRVKSVYDGRTFLYRLVKAYAEMREERASASANHPRRSRSAGTFDI